MHKMAFKVHIEEIEDEYWEMEARMPKAWIGILEDNEFKNGRIGEEYFEKEDPLDMGDPAEEKTLEVYNAEVELPPPPVPDAKPIALRRKRNPKPGSSAIGVSVLAVRGWVGSVENTPVDLRIDSGADITLVSEEFHKNLSSPLPIREGHKMNLAQLTDKGTTIRGFTKLKIFVPADSGDILELEAEAYVVKGMAVPILLGEDFQMNYELGVSRNVEAGTKISFRGTPFEVEATGVESFAGRAEAHALASNLTVHARNVTKVKEHRRAKARRRRRRRRNGVEVRTICTAEDYQIREHECRIIRVDGDFSEDREWLVERNLLANADDSFFSIPNMLISARKPVIGVSNLSSRPRVIRKGEVLGVLTDPQEYFDKPNSQEGWSNMRHRTALLSALIQVRMDADASIKKEPVSTAASDRILRSRLLGADTRIRTDFGSGVPPSEENEKNGVHIHDEAGRLPNGKENLPENPDEAESYGPKTAAMPDNSFYPSEDMEKLLDVGSLPERLKVKAWEMLRRRVRAFGFDGRLGHLDAKARIRVKEGVEPIAVPMYGSSPEKKRVIDAQLDKWFEQGVIEPSNSPWSAPVVIAYQNGKPRFCVDYRKLNAVTVADEFPIPRQSEILSSLSGAQVLSSLDALSGFNQLDMAPEDVEKTAFRTHRGLAQFRCMPFGLRNGPPIFQRIMQGILAPYLWLFCLVYINDIVVYSKSYDDHLEHLDKVLGAIEEAGVTLSPTKCHLFYSSILLLGHKVSRLGLSTHREKMQAILDLERPRKLSQLQAFLGMVVYFSAFIPFYASICAPLFQLLRKGSRWTWGDEQEHAFRAAKVVLQSAPLLGHPMEGLPYRLYSDASDEAAGVALQQVQPILVRDLKGTKAYARLEKAYGAKLPPPRLVTKLSTKSDDTAFQDEWGPTLDETTVHVERVIGYWSRSFKGAGNTLFDNRKGSFSSKGRLGQISTVH
ncbi:Retrovirus-related Pol polyprotein from transposon opus [Mycena venus]|uniref:Retrovirus-related Pol polyprotein from transposon opus n=1 Tax=Mycena venus TaxID=2733690 RepID=A0A8H6YU88_9AGAR|nr:Retrovirus-related Pol polyprotein from transposon opus [Mycena venus]